MAKNKIVTIQMIVGVLVFVPRWEGDAIYKVSRNQMFSMIPIIEIRRTFFPLTTLLLFPGPLFCMCTKIQLGRELEEV